MQAGKLDRRVTIERATMADDGFGQAPTWAELATVWASKRDVSDAERFASGEVAAQITTRFRIRWSSVVAGIDPRDRLICEGRTYDIVAVKEIGRREGLEITAAARADR
jgi:SPP1 family predicted phage head-tail adaptor